MYIFHIFINHYYCIFGKFYKFIKQDKYLIYSYVLYNVHSIMYTIYYKVYNVQYTMYNVQLYIER